MFVNKLILSIVFEPVWMLCCSFILYVNPNELDENGKNEAAL